MSGTQNRGRLSHFIHPLGQTTGHRLGRGFSEMSGNLGPQTREVTYIDDSYDSCINAYQPNWPVSGDYYDQDPANMLLYDLSVNLAKGVDAALMLIEARTWDKHETKTDTCRGFKQECIWAADSGGGGAGGETVTFSGQLKARGERVHGWVTITPGRDGAPDTATFSPED